MSTSKITGVSEADELSRREFLRTGLALGAVAVVPQLAGCASPAAEKPPAAEKAPTAAGKPQPLDKAPIQQTGGPRLTMHAIDTFHGATGAGLKFDLSVLEGNKYRLIKSFETIVGGRTTQPLLTGDELKAGRYEMMLYFEEYFSKLGAKLPNPPFLSKVPIRFAIYDASQKYHVPVLFSPWSYSYYRGS
jgi:5-hydroxyisourate hydrolase